MTSPASVPPSANLEFKSHQYGLPKHTLCPLAYLCGHPCIQIEGLKVVSFNIESHKLHFKSSMSQHPNHGQHNSQNSPRSYPKTLPDPTPKLTQILTPNSHRSHQCEKSFTQCTGCARNPALKMNTKSTKEAVSKIPHWECKKYHTKHCEREKSSTQTYDPRSYPKTLPSTPPKTTSNIIHKTIPTPPRSFKNKSLNSRQHPKPCPKHLQHKSQHSPRSCPKTNKNVIQNSHRS